MHACSSKTWSSHFGILIENLSDTNFMNSLQASNPQHWISTSTHKNITYNQETITGSVLKIKKYVFERGKNNLWFRIIFDNVFSKLS